MDENRWETGTKSAVYKCQTYRFRVIWTDLLKLTVDNNKCLLADELSTVSTEFSTICINTVNKCMNMKKIPVNTGIMKKRRNV